MMNFLLSWEGVRINFLFLATCSHKIGSLFSPRSSSSHPFPPPSFSLCHFTYTIEPVPVEKTFLYSRFRVHFAVFLSSTHHSVNVDAHVKILFQILLYIIVYAEYRNSIHCKNCNKGTIWLNFLTQWIREFERRT